MPRTARVGEDVLRDLVDTFDGRVFPTAASTVRAGARRRRRRPVHRPDVELAHPPGRRPPRRRRLRPRRRLRRDPRAPLRQPLRHDVPEHRAGAGTPPPHGPGPRVHSRRNPLCQSILRRSPAAVGGQRLAAPAPPRGGRLARRGAGPPGRGPARVLAVEPRLPRSARSCRSRCATVSWSRITTRPTCSGATATEEGPTCSSAGAPIGSAPRCCRP